MKEEESAFDLTEQEKLLEYFSSRPRFRKATFTPYQLTDRDLQNIRTTMRYLAENRDRIEAYRKEQDALGVPRRWRERSISEAIEMRVRSRKNIIAWLNFRKLSKANEGMSTNHGGAVANAGHEWLFRIRESANVEHILNAVEPDYLKKTGSKRKLVPKWINRRRLRKAIDISGVSYPGVIQGGSNALWKEREQRVRKVAEVAEALRVLVFSEDQAAQFCRDRLGSQFPLREHANRKRGNREAAPSFNGLEAGLKRLIRVARRELWSGRVKSQAPSPLPSSAFDWLVGTRLRAVYERWFGKDATTSLSNSESRAGRKFGKPTGAYIRFVQAALNDLNILTEKGTPYAEATIARAFRGQKAGRTRRKPKPRRTRHLP